MITKEKCRYHLNHKPFDPPWCLACKICKCNDVINSLWELPFNSSFDIRPLYKTKHDVRPYSPSDYGKICKKGLVNAVTLDYIGKNVRQVSQV